MARQHFAKKRSEVELWFADETGIEGDPRPRRRWARKGSRPQVGYYGKHLRANIVGAVCPPTGELEALVVSHNDREAFQAFLDYLAQQTSHQKEKSIIVVLDNATWHQLQPLYLPLYSSDLNPIEDLWKYIKEQSFTDWVAKTEDALYERIC